MPKITELYAYVVSDTEPDDEGVPGVMGANGMWFPLMGADMERAESLRDEAKMIANVHGKEVRLVRSTGLELVETITPD